MIGLTHTKKNVEVIQRFIDETKVRISIGTEITYTAKALDELKELALEYDIERSHITEAINNLTTDNYYQGTELSSKSDFDVCAFSTTISVNNIEIYLKYGLSNKGSNILVFSNHEPRYKMSCPFKI